MAAQRTYLAIDLKSFYASVECVDRHLDPLTTNLVVADASRTEKTICLAVSPSLKAYKIPGRARLFEAVQRVREVNAQRLHTAIRQNKAVRGEDGKYHFASTSFDANALNTDPALGLSYIVAPPRMQRYLDVSTQIYKTYLKYVSPADIYPYSIDEVFIDVTGYLPYYHMSAHDLAMTMVREVLYNTGITATAGIGTNLYLAKLAMDIVAKHIPADKDGVRIAELDEQSYRYLLWNHRPLTDFWMTGPGTVKKLEAHGIHDGIVADLGCGTGELTLMLTQAGYDMIGIDQSEEMLCVVRDKAEQLGLSGRLLLLRQDLLKLDLYGTIRAAVSTFDTFNHIPDLDTAIANAGFFMEKGGVFLFDMNTPYKHQKVLGDNEFTFEEEDAACVWRNHYNAADRKVEITVDIDYHETGEHFHEEFCEYTYDLATIRAALEKHGFALESVCDGETFGPLTEESQRYFFCATKQYTQLEE